MKPESWAVLAGFVIVWAGGYAFACWFWPFARCPKCKGTGSRPSPSGKYWRNCRKCGGGGRRMRTGLKAWRFVTGKS